MLRDERLPRGDSRGSTRSMGSRRSRLNTTASVPDRKASMDDSVDQVPSMQSKRSSVRSKTGERKSVHWDGPAEKPVEKSPPRRDVSSGSPGRRSDSGSRRRSRLAAKDHETREASPRRWGRKSQIQSTIHAVSSFQGLTNRNASPKKDIEIAANKITLWFRVMKFKKRLQELAAARRALNAATPSATPTRRPTASPTRRSTRTSRTKTGGDSPSFSPRLDKRRSTSRRSTSGRNSTKNISSPVGPRRWTRTRIGTLAVSTLVRAIRPEERTAAQKILKWYRIRSLKTQLSQMAGASKAGEQYFPEWDSGLSPLSSINMNSFGLSSYTTALDASTGNPAASSQLMSSWRVSALSSQGGTESAFANSSSAASRTEETVIIDIDAQVVSTNGENAESTITTWIEAVLPEEPRGNHTLGAWLQNGQILCTLANNIWPGIVPVVNRQNTVSREIDNINAFIRACHLLGVPEQSLFFPQDLHDERNLKAVCMCVYTLGCTIRKTVPSFKGPYPDERVPSISVRSKGHIPSAPNAASVERAIQHVEKVVSKAPSASPSDVTQATALERAAFPWASGTPGLSSAARHAPVAAAQPLTSALPRPVARSASPARMKSPLPVRSPSPGRSRSPNRALSPAARNFANAVEAVATDTIAFRFYTSELEGIDQQEFRLQFLEHLRARGLPLVSVMELRFCFGEPREERVGDGTSSFTTVELSGPGSAVAQVRAMNERERMAITGIASEVRGTQGAVDARLQQFSLDETTTRKLQRFLLARQVPAAKAVGEKFIDGKFNDVTVRALQELLHELKLPAAQQTSQSVATGNIDLSTIDALNGLLLADRAPPTITDILERVKSWSLREAEGEVREPVKDTSWSPWEAEGEVREPVKEAARDEEFRQRYAADTNLQNYVESRMSQYSPTDRAPVASTQVHQSAQHGTIGKRGSDVQDKRLLSNQVVEVQEAVPKREALLRKLGNSQVGATGAEDRSLRKWADLGLPRKVTTGEARPQMGKLGLDFANLQPQRHLILQA